MTDLTKMLGTSQAAKALDVCEARVRQMVAAGALPIVARTTHGNLYDPVIVADLAQQRAEQKAAQAAAE